MFRKHKILSNSLALAGLSALALLVNPDDAGAVGIVESAQRAWVTAEWRARPLENRA